MSVDDEAVTRLLAEAADGNREALEALMPIVYEELRRRASTYMRREQPGHTIQPTALVHEAYLRLLGEPGTQWQNKAHFLAIAALSMRQILVERARARGRLKRAGDQQRVTFNESTLPTPDTSVDLAELDDALTRLGELDPQLAKVIELRFFGGLSIDETAEVLGTSPATVKRGWASARAWLKRAMRTPAP